MNKLIVGDEECIMFIAGGPFHTLALSDGRWHHRQLSTLGYEDKLMCPALKRQLSFDEESRSVVFALASTA
jgi:hypothetical protein